MPDSGSIKRKPDWLRIKLPTTHSYSYIKESLTDLKLHTICESGKCPNIAECWAAKTATFMILGDICTRNCGFCAVTTGKPTQPNLDEPGQLAEAVKKFGLKHCVITSVTRDDLEDEGAEIWYQTVLKIKELNPDTSIEVLIPDFNNKKHLLDKIISSKPEIISHNLETVRRLTKTTRTRATYEKSLCVLQYLAEQGMTTKSGFMLGLGESRHEITETLEDLEKVKCKIVTIGQYLQPRKDNKPVEKYYTPEEFEEIKTEALARNFRTVECAPLVRSSYHAINHL